MCTRPLPLTSIIPRSAIWKSSPRSRRVWSSIWIRPGRPCDSIREAVLTVSPHRSYRKRRCPDDPSDNGARADPYVAAEQARGPAGWRSGRSRRARRRPGRARSQAVGSDPGRDDVGVADRLHLLQAVLFGQVVQGAEHPVEQLDDLAGGQPSRIRGEVHDVGEENRGRGDVVSDGFLAGLEPFRDGNGSTLVSRRSLRACSAASAASARSAAPTGRETMIATTAKVAKVLIVPATFSASGVTA